MKCVRSLEELERNMDTLDRYLDSKVESEYDFALERVKRGVCFAARKSGGSYRFYPSRFIGYTGNTMDKHLNNDTKDGKVTNPVISAILGKKPLPDPGLERAYRAWCERLGVKTADKGAFGKTRKYWKLSEIE